VSVVLPKRVSIDPIPTTTARTVSIISKLTRFIENCIVIWFVDDPLKKYENEKEQIRRFVYELQIFTNSDTCIDYIQNIQDEKIFLIISSKYQSIEDFFHLSQIQKIYILDSSSQQIKNPTLSSNIFSNINNLHQKLEQDINLCELDLIHFSIVSNSSLLSMNLTKEEISFIFTQFINQILNRLKFDNKAKDIWIEFCRIYYANHIEQLCIIDEFEKYYRPNTALDWLRRPCFISKILNRMTRTREIDVIHKLGFYLKHVNTQLLRLHEENVLLLKNISVVYRGKTMKKNEFDVQLKNSSNGLISFSNFLLTTINREDIIDFLRRRLEMHPDRIAIIFEIHIDHMIFNEESPFALIKGNNTKNDEICFSAGTVFRIESIEQIIDNSLIIWVIKLKLVQDNDPQLVNLLTTFRTIDIHENPLACLGKLLMDMGEYRRSEQFFLEMLNDTAVQNQPNRLVRVQIGLGANYTHKGDYAVALEYYKKSLELSLTYLPPDHPDLIFIYKSIGDCYLNQNNYMLALQNYERAIHIMENNTQLPISQNIDELRNLVKKTEQLI